MNIFFVSIRNLKQHLLATFLTGLSIALGISLVVSISSIKDQIKDHFFNISTRCEIIIGAKGSPLQLVLNSIYFMGAPTGNIDYQLFDTLKENSLIQMMIPVSLGDHYKESLIIGTSLDFFSDKNPLVPKKLTFKEGKPFNSTMQAVLGYNIAQENNLKVGDKIIAAHGILQEVEEHQHKSMPYTVCGILNQTNTPIDRAIFADMVSVWEIHEHHPHHNDKNHNHKDDFAHEHSESQPEHTELHSNHDHSEVIHENISIEEIMKDTEKIRKASIKSKYAPINYEHTEGKEITSVIVKLASPSYLFKLQREINDTTNYQAVNPAYEVQKLISLMGNVDKLLIIISYLVIVVAVISVLVSSYHATSNRSKEIAILRAIGASKKWIIFSILIEIFFICLCGWILGLIFGHLLIAISAPIVLKTSSVYIRPFIFSQEMFIVLPVILILGGLSAILPALKVYKTDVAQNLVSRQ